MAIKAVRSKKLNDISTMMRNFHLSEDIEAGNVTWRVRTLEPSEILESDAFVRDGTEMQQSRSIGRAQITFALTHIDGKPIEDEFAVPTTGDPEELKALENPDIRRLWRREQIWEYLIKEVQDEVLAKIWEGYVELLKRKRTAMDGLSGFKKGTPSTESSPT